MTSKLSSVHEARKFLRFTDGIKVDWMSDAVVARLARSRGLLPRDRREAALDLVARLRADAAPAPRSEYREDIAAPPPSKGPSAREFARKVVQDAYNSSWSAAHAERQGEISAAVEYSTAGDRERHARESVEQQRQSAGANFNAVVRAAYDASFTESAMRATAAGRAEVDVSSGGVTAKDPVAEAYAASWRRDGL